MRTPSLNAGPSTHATVSGMRLKQRLTQPNWPMLAVMLVAAALRLWQLGAIPPGFQFDEAYNALDAASVLDGHPALFFPANGGREPLLIYLHALFLQLLGRDHPAFELRLVSAFIGIVTVAIVYRAVSSGLQNRRLGVLAAAFLATSYWHVHFSRYGIRAVLAPLWATLAVWAWLRAVGSPGESGIKDPRHVEIVGSSALKWAVVCGICLAGAVYSHPTGRLLPLILIGHALYRTLAIGRDDSLRPSLIRTWRALVIAGTSAAVLSLPLLAFFYQHPDLFVAHPADVSLQAVADKQFGGMVALALLSHLGAVLGMFFIQGDPSTFHNLPGLPVFDPVTALLALVGVGAAVGVLWRTGGGAGVGRNRGVALDRAMLLALWLGVMLMPTVLSDRPPNYSRAIAALPVIVLMPAYGLAWWVGLLNRAKDGKGVVSKSRLERSAFPASAIALAMAWTGWHYFVTFAQLPQVYRSYDVDKVDAFHALAAMSDDAHVFLAPVWAEHATIAYLNQETRPPGARLRSLDARDTLVLPADRRDVVIAAPVKEADKEDWAKALAELTAGRAMTGTVDTYKFADMSLASDQSNPKGEPLLYTWRIHAADLGDLSPPKDAPLEPADWSGALFGDVIRMVGYTPAGPAGAARPGEVLPVTVVWKLDKAVEEDLTVSVKLVGPQGQAWGQEDREPGWASYRTSQWAVGDVVIDRYEPVLADEARGEVTIQVSWYNLSTGRVLSVAQTNDRAVYNDQALSLAPISVMP